MKTLKKPNKTQHDEKRDSLAISRNVRKQRGLAFGRLDFARFLLVGTPGFEPGVTSSSPGHVGRRPASRLVSVVVVAGHPPWLAVALFAARCPKPRSVGSWAAKT